MKTCPNCSEILGDKVNRCFNCSYDFSMRKVIDSKKGAIAIEKISQEGKELKSFKPMLLTGVNGSLTVYEDRIVIGREGFLGFATHGLAGDKTILMSSVQSVQFRPGTKLVNGFIQFGVLGGKEGRGGVFNATQDENTIMVREGAQSITARTIAEYVQKRILELSKPQTQTQTIMQEVKTSHSNADEILKYKNLLDIGAITKEEFEAKKKQLLGL